MTVMGYIKLHRTIFEHWLWDEKPYDRARAWIDLLMLANHKDNKISIKGRPIEVRRGQTARSSVSLAERWGWSRGKVSRFLDTLEAEQQIEQQKSNVTTVITIVNYEQYQGNGQQTIQQTKQQTDSRRTADGQQTDTNNNDKNENNDNNENICLFPQKQFSQKIPSIDKMKQLAPLVGVSAEEAEACWHHYNAQGWVRNNNIPITDERSLLVTWRNNGDKFKCQDKNNGKIKLYPITGKTCCKRDCRLPAVYKDSSGEYDTYYCAEHMPQEVKKHYAG